MCPPWELHNELGEPSMRRKSEDLLLRLTCTHDPLRMSELRRNMQENRSRWDCISIVEINSAVVERCVEGGAVLRVHIARLLSPR